MNSPEAQGDLLKDQPTSPSPSQFKALEEVIGVFKRLLLGVLLAFIFLALGVNAFLLRETRQSLRRLNEARTVITKYEREQLPSIQNFAGSLHAFANTHPDFQVILRRYIQPAVSNAPAAPASPAQPARLPPSGQK